MKDASLIILLSLLHLVAIAAGAGLLWFAASAANPDEQGDAGEDAGGGGGGERPRHPTRRPSGGLLDGPPLPDATAARVRLRAPGRLAELLPRRTRRDPRPVRAPRTPAGSN